MKEIAIEIDGIKVTPNTYRVSDEVNKQAVQAICDTFLKNIDKNYWLYPSNENKPNNCVIAWKDSLGEHRMFTTEGPMSNDTHKIRFNTAEMKKAFEVLIKAGYHFFKIVSINGADGYRFTEKPYYQDYPEANEFEGFID